MKIDLGRVQVIMCVNDLPDPKEKFLGVVLDPTLNVHDHIKSISTKVSKLNNRWLKGKKIMCSVRFQLKWLFHVYCTTAEMAESSVLYDLR